MIYMVLIVIHVIVCLVLIAVILLQAGKGGGLAQIFGGGTAETVLGTRASTVLTKATTACAIIFILTSLALAILSRGRARSLLERAPIPEAERTLLPPEEAVEEELGEPIEEVAEPKEEPIEESK